MVTTGEPLPAAAPTPTPAPAPAPVPAPVRRARLGLPTEVALWFLVLALVGSQGMRSGLGFVGVEPSPLWLPIVWAALRSGLTAGLFTAGCAGLLHAVGLMADSGPALELLVAPAVTWPLAVFAAVAFAIGHARDTLAERLRAAQAEQAAQRERADARTREVEMLRHVNHELKRKVFDRAFDFESVMATVARTSVSGDEKAFDVPLSMLVDFCGVLKCSVLLVLPDGVLDLAAHRGWTEEEIPLRLAAAARSPRLQRVIAQARPIVTLGEDAESGVALLVAPLADATGAVRALLCIDELPPLRFDQGTVKTFLGIAAWVANNMRRIEVGGASQETWKSVQATLSAHKAIGTPEQLSQRLFLEDARRARYGIESVLVALRVLDVRTSMPEHVAALEGQVRAVLAAALRLTDDVFRFGFAGCYMVVLTGCKEGSADVVLERLKERFAVNGGADLGTVDVAVFVPDQDARCLADLLPRLTQHFFGAPIAGLDLRCPVPEPHSQRSGNAHDLVARLRLELELAKRYEIDLNLVDFRGRENGSGTGPMVARHLWNMVGTVLRVTDGIYVLGPDRCVVLLPCTTCLDASRIWQRLEDALRRSLPEGRYEAVQAEFLALTDMDAQQTLRYLVGAEDAGTVDTPIVSDVELSELTFSESELAQLRGNAGGGGLLPAVERPDPRRQESLERFLQHVAELQRLGSTLQQDLAGGGSPAAADDPASAFAADILDATWGEPAGQLASAPGGAPAASPWPEEPPAPWPAEPTEPWPVEPPAPAPWPEPSATPAGPTGEP